ncbi:hypothetical protein Lal_00039247 [Lupinus albus]|nr:hypothetical protein Lal_00039247 [Lupinus albus]
MEHDESQPLINDEPKDTFVGQIVKNIDEAYNLYQAHAFKMGFSVRKGQQQFYDNDRKNIRLKEYYCSKKGFKNNELQGEVAYERADSRTGCEAMVRFNVNKEGQWKITKLVLDHNHEFAQPHQRHLLRSMRNISATKGDVIKSLVNVGMSDAWNYNGEEVSVFDKASSIVKDMQNFVYTQKVKSIEAGDAQSLVNQLQKRQSEDPMFYYTVQFDQESRLTNVFWRDGKSKLDYDCFGDVMVFDTTYRTNRFNLICAPFVGVNHHWQNVMFGCALLADETAVSFTWLFKAFLESMGNQQPKRIFTHQDASMAKAIRELKLNPYVITNDINSTQNENNGHVSVLNPLLAKTNGMSTTRKKGHFQKRKRSTTIVKKNKEKRKERSEFCDTNKYSNDSNMPSSTMSLYKPIMPQMAPPIIPQMAPSIIPQMTSSQILFGSPLILQPAFGMQNIGPTPIRPHALRKKTSEDGTGSENHVNTRVNY